MATIFGGSRLANLRQKRTSGDNLTTKTDQPLKLGLPQDNSDKHSYQPSSLFTSTRTNTRLLKGRIDRPSENAQNKAQIENSYTPTTTIQGTYKSKITSNSQTEQLRLVINDDVTKIQERRGSVDGNPLRTTQKRILISKEPEKDKVIEQQIEKTVVEDVRKSIGSDVEPQKPNIISQKDNPIRQEQVEESMQQGENDLVECPQGCGRKFNRKALERHAKACKLVFMSKRKEFNSEAKRAVNKEQAGVGKAKAGVTKGKVKGKGFQKTGQNWKSASQDFRAAIKAIKKETVQEEGDGQQDQQQMKIIPCKFCEKPFAQVFLQKHLQNCGKRKQGEKKKTTKKK